MAKLKVGIIGTGLIATKKHIPSYQKIREICELTALCDTDAEKAAQVAVASGIPRSYSDVGHMIREAKLDLVSVCTPPKTHKDVAILAMKAGAHALIEKPLAMDENECDEILEVSRVTGRQACVAHSDLFYPSFMKARQWVQEGRIGRLKGMTLFLSTPVDYITSKQDHWANKLPGGVIGESGPHLVYMALAFLPRVTQVRAAGYKKMREYPWSPYEDYRIEIISEDVICSAVAVYDTQQWAAEMQLWGEKGMIKADLESMSIVLSRRPRLGASSVGVAALGQSLSAAGSVIAQGLSYFTGRYRNTHDHLIQKFAEAIRNNQPVPATLEEGREAVRVMRLLTDLLKG